jgi:hypothetical protein
VLIKQLLHCVLIKQLLIVRAVSKRAPIKPWRATQAKILHVRLALLAASSNAFDTARWPDEVIAQATGDVRHT